MGKDRLSQLLDDAAFPVLALAVAVSQVNLRPDKESNLIYLETQSAKPQLNDRSQGSTETDAPSGPSRSARGGETTSSNKKSNLHE
jgi:hypothetical protein